MKSKQEPTQIPKAPWAKLSPEQWESTIEWLEKTKADLRPVSHEQQTRRVMKAYLEAPIETRHLAAKKAAADYESEQRERGVEGARRKKEMDRSRRQSNVVAVFCGLLGAVILPIVACRAGVQDDRFLTIFCITGLYGGWMLGANYAYFLFFDENGKAKPNAVRVQATVQKWRGRMCATGLHSWEKRTHTKICRVCGKQQVI